MNHRNWSSVRLLAWLLPAVALASCSSIVGDGAVRIRVRNASAVDFDSTNIVFQSETERYGGIRAGRSTDYRAVGLAYRYARIEVWVGNSPSLLQPIDFVGETPLKGGSYTYELNLAAGTNHLTLNFLRD